MTFVVYTDGSGTTGGPAGIGYVAFNYDAFAPDVYEREGSLPLADATNQQAEILAAAYALHELPEGQDVVVRSDSQYLVRGFGWLPGWIERGWRNSGGRVKNVPYWKRLLAAASRHESVRFEWVRGHNGDSGNERADALAGAARALAIQTYRETA